MATASNTFLSSTTLIYAQKVGIRRQVSFCKAQGESSSGSTGLGSGGPVVTKRGLSISLGTSLVFSVVGGGWFGSNAAILEADDDVELLEKVKKDRQKRLEKQLVISSAKKETGDLQGLVFRLSKVGQAIDGNDLSTARSVLGDKDWVKKANVALNKLSSSPEEQTEVDAFNSSLASLISSVTKNDQEASKLAFVASATAIEKWTALTGLVGQLKGL
ncbi:thylakoid lumenal 16.5 kDa protein, chloroplastic [Argentina anserina]|uniref:thylakoid lumenal 16.5 kDa protein, chloroplastic n=1 Tax=Argentina anserina TaxID=57926 RepID=UPI0021765EA2|nr:thylakoid lumenal 16.5 kDa protein, chloroplastic [Potentilla anserina]